MFAKSNVICTIVTAIWGFVGGYLLWGLLGETLFADYLGSATGVMKAVPDMAHIALGCLIQAFAFSTLYGKGEKGSYGISSGIIFGLWLALLIGLGEGLIDYATANILNLTGTMVNFVLCIVFFGVMGMLAGLVYKKTTS